MNEPNPSTIYNSLKTLSNNRVFQLEICCFGDSLWQQFGIAQVVIVIYMLDSIVCHPYRLSSIQVFLDFLQDFVKYLTSFLSSHNYLSEEQTTLIDWLIDRCIELDLWLLSNYSIIDLKKYNFLLKLWNKSRDCWHPVAGQSFSLSNNRTGRLTRWKLSTREL